MNPAVAQLTERLAQIKRERAFNAELLKAIYNERVWIEMQLALRRKGRTLGGEEYCHRCNSQPCLCGLMTEPGERAMTREEHDRFPNGRYTT